MADIVGFESASFSTLGAIALQGIRLADVKLGEVIAVIALGLVGQLMVQLLKAAGCIIVGMNIQPRRAEQARQFGADAAVDEPVTLGRQMQTLHGIADDIPVLFPVHPRTRQRLQTLSLAHQSKQLFFVDPLVYLEFLALQRHSSLIITDSGGIQEETTYLGVPCLTVRGNTARPVTVTLGTNTLVGQDMERLYEETQRILRGDAKHGVIPPLWDGRTGERIADVIAEL